MMSDDAADLRVRFEGPQNGWLVMTLAVEEVELRLSVSYVPNDFLSELASAIALLAKGGEGYATANSEPQEVELRFSTVEGHSLKELIVVERRRADSRRGETVLLSIRSTLNGIVGPFVSALSSLEARVGLAAYRDDMRREFPSQKLREIQELKA